MTEPNIAAVTETYAFEVIGSPNRLIGIFLTKELADKAAEGRGFLGSKAYISKIPVVLATYADRQRIYPLRSGTLAFEPNTILNEPVPLSV